MDHIVIVVENTIDFAGGGTLFSSSAKFNRPALYLITGLLI